MNIRRIAPLLALLSLAVTGSLPMIGCSPDFTPVTLVDHARVLGARVEVVGDATRSNPRPGESASVRFLVTFPAEDLPLSWALLSCVPEPTSFGAPRCAQSAGEPAVQLEPAFGAPQLNLALPDEAALGDADQLLVFGSICAQGQTNLDPALPEACANSDDVGTQVVLQLPLDRHGETNHHPGFDSVLLNDEILSYVAPTDALASGCVRSAAPQLMWGEDVVALRLTAADTSRETYTAQRGAPPMPTALVEELQVESVTTAGELDRHFAFFDDLNPTVDLEWTVPPLADVASDGSLVRLTFTMRDGRGGFDFTSRAVCLVAPSL